MSSTTTLPTLPRKLTALDKTTIIVPTPAGAFTGHAFGVLMVGGHECILVAKDRAACAELMAHFEVPDGQPKFSIPVAVVQQKDVRMEN